MICEDHRPEFRMAALPNGPTVVEHDPDGLHAAF
jgi:hypothetical protein